MSNKTPVAGSQRERERETLQLSLLFENQETCVVLCGWHAFALYTPHVIKNAPSQEVSRMSGPPPARISVSVTDSFSFLFLFFTGEILLFC